MCYGQGTFLLLREQCSLCRQLINMTSEIKVVVLNLHRKGQIQTCQEGHFTKIARYCHQKD